MANVKLTYINSTGGYVQPTETTDVVQNIGKIELTGVGGVAIDAGAAKISNIGSPAASDDAATKGYVDALAYGVAWKAPVRAVSTGTETLSGSQTIDGVSLTDGDRVLVAGQGGNLTTPSVDNGIYVVDTGGSWTRATDADAVGELPAGSAVFVTEGTSYADSQFVLTTNGTITPGSTAIVFTQFGASSSYNAGNGLTLTGSTFSVALATNSGLEFNGSAELQIDVASTDELSLDANGLNVEGVPTQFKIGGNAVSANVTQTNLDALTDSASITALHRHANIQFTAINAYDNFADGEVGYYDAVNGGMTLARAHIAATSGVVGLAVGSVVSGTSTGKFLTHGTYAGFSGLTAGVPYYLSDTVNGGLMLYSALTSGSRAIRIGIALSTTALAINIQDMGVKP